MGLYQSYKTSPKLEKEGVWREFGECRVLIARAGGTNQKYNAVMEKIGKEQGRALKAGLVSNEKAVAILSGTYADTVILAWETFKDGEYVSGIEGPEGDLLPFTPENVKATLLALPGMLMEIREIAEDQQFYLQSIIDGAAKN